MGHGVQLAGMGVDDDHPGTGIARRAQAFAAAVEDAPGCGFAALGQIRFQGGRALAGARASGVNMKLARNGKRRAAGSACAKNKIAIIIPCHRIVKTGGALGAYGWGVDKKLWLLKHEGALD